VERFTYFMVRIRRPAELPDATLSGLVEQLATGEKRNFASAEELIRIVGSWPDAECKIRCRPGEGNKAGTQ
jgi:hypothetical protein